MPLDWFTVVAQTINFLILVWLLKHFLYKPILNAIDAREKGIASTLADADSKRADAQKERDEFQQKSESFDRERAALLKKATDDADSERKRLLDETRKNADALRAKRQEALVNEQRHLSEDITRWTQNEVFAIARKTLADLASASLEERMCEVFVQRLGAINGTDKELISAAFKKTPQPAHVRSAFPMLPSQKNLVETAVKETLGTETPILFETVPELVSGIELSVDGQKVAWCIADYLATLEKKAYELFHGDGLSESEPVAIAEPANVTDSKAEVKPEAKVAATLETNHILAATPSLPKADH